MLETFAAVFSDHRIEELAFWRSASGYEVDLLIDRHTAVEVKSGRVHPVDRAGLLALSDNGIEVLPWRTYIERLKTLSP